MRAFRDLPIARKLTLIAMVASGAALLVACTAFVIYDQVSLRRAMARDMGVIANMLAFNTASALSFSDADSAKETLAGLTAQPHITAACVYDSKGGVFATYTRGDQMRVDFPAVRAESATFTPTQLEIFRPIQLAGEHSGTVYVETDLQQIRDRFTSYLWMFGGVIVVAALLAYLLAARLQRVISGPLSQLAAVAERVATEKNYTIRAARQHNDELGRLFDRFNDMLAQIQTRDVALQRAHDDLEQRVTDRTRELLMEIAERRRTEEERDGFFTLSLDLLCIASLDGRFRRVNPAAREVLGYTHEELAGALFTEFLHPEERPAVEHQLRKLGGGESVRNFETRLRHRDGSYRWIAWSAAPVPGQEYFYAYGRDVTALKQAEHIAAREKARLQFIFESVSVGISLRMTEPDGHCTRMANAAHFKITGLTRAQLEDPDIYRKITHPEDFIRQHPFTRQLESGQIDRYTLEKRYVKSDGEITWVAFSLQRNLYPDGSFEELSTQVDITELKQAQERIAREQARFKFIFDSVPVGISLVAPGAGQTHLVNPAHERITGVAAADSSIPGIFAAASDPDDYRRQLERAQPIIRGEVDHYSVEKRYRHRDGTVVWAVLTTRRFNNADTGNQLAITTLIDITDLKAAQEEVVAERARFKFIFDSVPVGISLLVPGPTETHLVNPAHTRITGIEPHRLTEPGVFERASHPGDYARDRPLVERYKRGEIDSFTLEKRYLHPDGRVVWASLTRRRFCHPTGGLQSITTVVDITELKEAQEQNARQQARFKFIFEAVPVGLAWMVRSAHETRIVNPAHARITGVPAERCRELELYRQATHPEDRARQEALQRRLLAGEVDHYELEKRYVRADGAVRWAALSVRLFGDVSGETQEISTLVDITDRKEAEARLAETHRQLMETSRQAGMAEVATGVLHNVGNVLNSVNVSTTVLGDKLRQSKVDKVGKLGELLQEQAADLAGFFGRDPRGKQVPAFLQSLATHLTREQTALLAELDSLRKNVEHIKDIVAMQQSYAKVSGVAEPIAAVDLVEDAVRMNSGGFRRDDIKLVREFESRPTVVTEKHKVLQILVNLLRNAKHACDDANKPEKTMVVRIVSDATRVRISVTDNGVGIPRENLTRIFAHGFTTKKNGHGFGLHSGALAARELGGALTASSEGVGLGATFTLELPLKAEAKAA